MSDLSAPNPPTTDPRDMIATGDLLATQAAAIDRAIRTKSGVLSLARVLVELCAPLGGPAGLTAGMIATRAIRMAEAERGL